MPRSATAAVKLRAEGKATAARHQSDRCEFCLLDSAFLTRTQRPAFESLPDPVGVVDLFSGCGGLTLGVAEAARRAGRGFAGLLAVDFDEQAVAAYQRNFPGSAAVSGTVEGLLDGELGTPPTTVEKDLLRDVAARAKKPAGEAVDFLIGGPPCQGHSDLNNRSRRDDPRNKLYLRMVRAAEVLRPRALLIENVPAVLHAKNDVVTAAIRHLTETLDYSVAHRVLDLSDLGVPQRRRRHLLLALANGDAPGVLAAVGRARCPPRTARWAFKDLLEREESSPFDTAPSSSKVNRARMEWFFEDPENRYELPNSHRPDCHRLKAHSYKSVYGRMRWDEPAQTVTTGFSSMGQGRYVHPAKPRTITPHEAARLQGFPDFFDFGPERRTSWSKLIGNAVPPPLSEAIVEAVLALWSGVTNDSASFGPALSETPLPMEIQPRDNA